MNNKNARLCALRGLIDGAGGRSIGSRFNQASRPAMADLGLPAEVFMAAGELLGPEWTPARPTSPEDLHFPIPMILMYPREVKAVIQRYGTFADFASFVKIPQRPLDLRVPSNADLQVFGQVMRMATVRA